MNFTKTHETENLYLTQNDSEDRKEKLLNSLYEWIQNQIIGPSSTNTSTHH